MNQIIFGDCRESMRQLHQQGIKIQTCVTSPPYFGLRDYGHDGQIGLEQTPDDFVNSMVDVFRHVREIMADDGTLWLNLGDSYNGSGGNHKPHHKNDSGFQGKVGAENHKGRGNTKLPDLKPKDLIGIPWRVAFALQADGWYLRQDIVWHKPNPMPESVRDRCTKAHEYIFLLSKSQKYYFDHEAIKEPTNDNSEKKNKRSVWTVNLKPYKGAHFAVYPEQLIEPCIIAGSPEGGIVFDPFMGSGTTAAVAIKNKRQYLGCELNPEYKALQDDRIAKAFSTLAANDNNPQRDLLSDIA